MSRKEKLMKLTEKQKNCPYCHDGDNANDLLSLKYSNYADSDVDVFIEDGQLLCDVDVGIDNRDDYFYKKIDINYCPMCGRLMNKEEE